MSNVLSSDVLEAQFGPTDVEVLLQNEDERITSTATIKNGIPDQTLEISQVRFKEEGAAKFPDVHQAVIEGQSIGKALRAAGVALSRSVYAGYKYSLPANFNRCFGSNKPATVFGVKILVGHQ